MPNRTSFHLVPFVFLVACSGSDGPAGPAGAPGASCSVVEAGGERKVVCDDGTEVVIPGSEPCTIAAGVITCPDGTSAPLPIDSGATSGDIRGSVVVAARASSEGVQVRLDGASSPLTTSTDVNGDFVFDEVRLGVYTLRVSTPGYEDASLQVLVAPGVQTLEKVYLTRGALLADVARTDGAWFSPSGDYVALKLPRPALDGDDLWRYDLATGARERLVEKVRIVIETSQPGVLIVSTGLAQVDAVDVASGAQVAIGLAIEAVFSPPGAPATLVETSRDGGGRVTLSYVRHSPLAVTQVATGTAGGRLTNSGRYVAYNADDNQIVVWDSQSETSVPTGVSFSSLRSAGNADAFIYQGGAGLPSGLLSSPGFANQSFGIDVGLVLVSNDSASLFYEVGAGSVFSIRRVLLSSGASSLVDDRATNAGGFSLGGTRLIYQRSPTATPLEAEARVLDFSLGTNDLLRANTKVGTGISRDGRWAFFAAVGSVLEVCDLDQLSPACTPVSDFGAFYPASLDGPSDGSNVIFVGDLTSGGLANIYMPLIGPSALLPSGFTGSPTIQGYLGSRFVVGRGTELIVRDVDGSPLFDGTIAAQGVCLARTAFHFLEPAGSQMILWRVGTTGAPVVVDPFVTSTALGCSGDGVTYVGAGGPFGERPGVYAAP